MDESKTEPTNEELKAELQWLRSRVNQMERERSRPSSVGTYTSEPSKAVAVAYILWFLLGQLGAHRFYLGSPLGVLHLVLAIAGWVVFWLFSIIGGAIILGILALLLIYDLLWINEAVNEYNSNN